MTGRRKQFFTVVNGRSPGIQKVAAINLEIFQPYGIMQTDRQGAANTPPVLTARPSEERTIGYDEVYASRLLLANAHCFPCITKTSVSNV